MGQKTGDNGTCIGKGHVHLHKTNLVPLKDFVSPSKSRGIFDMKHLFPLQNLLSDFIFPFIPHSPEWKAVL